MSLHSIPSAEAHSAAASPLARAPAAGSQPRSEQPGDPSALKVLENPAWRSEAWLVHGFSTRSGGVPSANAATSPAGDLNLGFTGREPEDAVRANRARFVRAVVSGDSDSGDGWGLVTLKQMHSSLVRRVTRAEIAERASLWGDGMITADAGVLLGIQTADCLPILIADPGQRAVGAFHAGWRGTLKGIVQHGVAAMVREFGSAPGNLTAAIGPGIGRCCFAVGAEVRSLFAARYSYWDKLFGEGERLSLDLVGANRRQLLDCGLAKSAIFALEACTSCRTDEFFSYRAERGSTGRLMAAIGIKPR